MHALWSYRTRRWSQLLLPLAALVWSMGFPGALLAAGPRSILPAARLRLPTPPNAAESMIREVAVSGDTMVVSSFALDPSQAKKSVVWVYRHTAQGWQREAALAPAGGAVAGVSFGVSVAVSGNTIVVGAPDTSAYVFVRHRGTWRQQAVLTGETQDISSAFGRRVAISGDRILIAGPDATNERSGGAAFAFVRSGQSWQPDGSFADLNNDFYGSLIAISGGLAAVGSSSGIDVFVRRLPGWYRRATFGGAGFVPSSVALSGTTLAMGSPQQVEIWVRSGATWLQQAVLPPVETRPQSLALDGDILVASAGGSVHVYTREGSSWAATAVLEVPPGFSAAGFGRAVAVSGSTAAVASDGPAWIFEDVDSP